MPQMSKEKGSSFERLIATRFSLWVSDLKKKDVFWRSAMSGGRTTFHNRKKHTGEFENSLGDLTAIDPLGELLLKLFVVECKFWKEIDLQRYVFGRLCLIDKEWKKTLKQARDFGREPFFVMKQNSQYELVGTTQRGVEILRRGEEDGKRVNVRAIFPDHEIIVVPLMDVLMLDFNRFRERFVIENGTVREIPESEIECSTQCSPPQTSTSPRLRPMTTGGQSLTT